MERNDLDTVPPLAKSGSDQINEDATRKRT